MNPDINKKVAFKCLGSLAGAKHFEIEIDIFKQRENSDCNHAVSLNTTDGKRQEKY